MINQVQMKIVESVSGTALLEMLTAATDWLEQHAAYIDSLNVFPVPDGDTGTNMLFSMRAAVEEARKVPEPEPTASSIAAAFARGALMDARGNSGIILSQLWQGLARGIEEKQVAATADLVQSLQRAATLSVQALSKPVQGTILTVIQDIAAAARSSSVVEEDLVTLVERLVGVAEQSVAATQSQLQVLRQAGVVDAGAEGLHVILEGCLYYLQGRRPTPRRSRTTPAVSASGRSAPGAAPIGEAYGFCTEFVLTGNNLRPEKIRTALEERGQSLVVAGDESTVRVHIHTPDPDSIVRRAGSLGTIQRLSVRDMDEQHRAYRTETAGVLAIVPGQGFAEIFASLGAQAIVVDTLRPPQAVETLLETIEKPGNSGVFVLPNRADLIPLIQEATTARREQIRVVPAKTIPEGICAALAYNPTEDNNANNRLMERAIEQVHSIELKGNNPRTGRVTALLDGFHALQGESTEQVLEGIMAELDVDKADVVTVYHSRGIAAETVRSICAGFRRADPHLQVTTICAGLFGSDLIISVE
jgi:DAK2 domain fusion protein YloV